MAVRARAQCVIPYFTGLPEDVITNTWHFENLTTMDLAAISAAVQPALVDFYQEIYAGSWSRASHLGASAQWHTNWYDLADPPPRPPLTLPLMPTTIAVSASQVPTEVACVLSFQADPQAGVPQARRRGRIFLGGAAGAWMTAGSASTFPSFATVFTQAVAAAAETLRDAVLAAGARWVVYSPTTDLTSLVSNGWVDNECDTQRRRGVEATVRTLWS